MKHLTDSLTSNGQMLILCGGFSPTGLAYYWREQHISSRAKLIHVNMGDLIRAAPIEAPLDDTLRGVIFILGTAHHTEPWTNPSGSEARVIVRGERSCTGGEPWTSAALQGILQREHREHLESGEMCGAGEFGASIRVDLGLGCIVWPRAYCIGFGTCGAQWFTHWRLEASTGDDEWVLLKEHAESVGFQPGEVKSFSISPPRYPMRHFRIAPTHAPGENRCLHLYHFDVFGTMCELLTGGQ